MYIKHILSFLYKLLATPGFDASLSSVLSNQWGSWSCHLSSVSEWASEALKKNPEVSPTSSMLTLPHVFWGRDWAGEKGGLGVLARAEGRKSMRVWWEEMRGRLEKEVKGWRKLLTSDLKRTVIHQNKFPLFGYLKILLEYIGTFI